MKGGGLGEVRKKAKISGMRGCADGFTRLGGCRSDLRGGVPLI